MPRKNPEKQKEYDRDYHARNKGRWPKSKEYNREIMREYRKTHREEINAQRIALREQKAGRKRSETCEVCNVKTKTYFDHDHATGKFRGWLCRNCNLALGYAKDSPPLLKALMNYVILHYIKEQLAEKGVKVTH